MADPKLKMREIEYVFSDTHRDTRDYHESLGTKQAMKVCFEEDVRLAAEGKRIIEPWTSTNYPRPELLKILLDKARELGYW